MILRRKNGIWYGVALCNHTKISWHHASAGRVMFVLAAKKAEIEGMPK